MVEASTAKGRLGATPKKLTLIGVLAVVLVVVMYVQFGRSSEEDAAGALVANSPAERPENKTMQSVTKAVTPVTDTKEWLLEPINRPHWKTPEVAQVVRYDPFALPAAFPQPAGQGVGSTTSPEGVVAAVDAQTTEDLRAKALAEIQTKLADLKQRGVRVIIDGRKQAAAIVGDRTIHVGDDIEGFTVTAIDPDGVVVERKLD